MPRYDYLCPMCSERFELDVKWADAKETEVCPKCGGDASKQISRSGIAFKGKGWTPKFGKGR